MGLWMSLPGMPVPNTLHMDREETLQPSRRSRWLPVTVVARHLFAPVQTLKSSVVGGRNNTDSCAALLPLARRKTQAH